MKSTVYGFHSKSNSIHPRHAYYRQLRLPHEHFACDPARLTEAQLRDYFLFPKLRSVAGGGRLLSRINVLSQPHRPQY